LGRPFPKENSMEILNGKNKFIKIKPNLLVDHVRPGALAQT
jgi:hypothetical protein